MTRVDPSPSARGRVPTGARGAVLAVLLLATACTPVPAPLPSATSLPSMVHDETGINGQVVDEAGAPLADVLVTIESGNFVGDTHTTADGTFSARGVFGDFRITAFELGFTTAQQVVSVVPNQIVEVTLVMSPSGEGG